MPFGSVFGRSPRLIFLSPRSSGRATTECCDVWSVAVILLEIRVLVLFFSEDLEERFQNTVHITLEFTVF
jgi:hypothetical protein